MSTLRASLGKLADDFASGVLAAIRTASIEDLLAESGSGGRRGAGTRRGRAAGGGSSRGQPVPLETPGKKSRGTKGRLARRSPEDIDRVLQRVVAAVKGAKSGLRSEDIRQKLGLDVREVPRVLKAGLASKVLSARGQKRATRYFAAGAGGRTAARRRVAKKAKGRGAKKK